MLASLPSPESGALPLFFHGCCCVGIGRGLARKLSERMRIGATVRANKGDSASVAREVKLVVPSGRLTICAVAMIGFELSGVVIDGVDWPEESSPEFGNPLPTGVAGDGARGSPFSSDKVILDSFAEARV